MIGNPVIGDDGAIIVDLPTPPSVNRIWRANKAGAKRVSISKEYDSWKKSADGLSFQLGQFRSIRTLRGPFEADIVIKRIPGSDLDNRIKGVLDWLQSRAVIENDRHAEKITIKWARREGEAPWGCRVTLWPAHLTTMVKRLETAE